ncbi:hypothetical protein EDD18DRAFT_202040 [Armillaria luteobubalina]|uniref:Glucose-methanol-choline oxidoreductase C-terminal domain-containing protein n=1 Tax=Armillaria luteobubalina TaxID=153913 RepID=A0AA39UT55_9AGAR|nr:hypothetical protein EDD18DRAFT_202040 [Armillaria luteobubalina]
MPRQVALPQKSLTAETTPGANYSTSESLQEWLLPNFKTMSHFVGTTAAIAQEDGGVVDPTTFIVYGTSNVRVVDASVIPLLPGIHTQVSVLVHPRSVLKVFAVYCLCHR